MPEEIVNTLALKADNAQWLNDDDDDMPANNKVLVEWEEQAAAAKSHDEWKTM